MAEYRGLTAEELVRLLMVRGDDVPLELAEAIVSWGPEVLPELCQFVSDERWWQDERSALGFHALHLVGAIGDPSAAPALLAPLWRNEESDIITENVPGILARLGPKAIPELQAFVEDLSQDSTMRSVVYTGLVGMTVLHPEVTDQVKSIGRNVANRCLLEGEPIPAVLGIGLAEFQDPHDLKLLEKLNQRGLWEEWAFPWSEVLDAFREGRPEAEVEHATLDPMRYFGG